MYQMQLGLLSYASPSFNKYWGLTKKINELYNVPKQIKEHNHLPDHDAYTIGHNLNVVLGIKEGWIKPL